MTSKAEHQQRPKGRGAQRLASRFLREENGQSIIMGAFGMFVIVAFVGLAVDVGTLRYDEHNLQAAAESAALAAALEETACSGTNACSAMQTAAQSALTENGLTGITVTTNCTAGSAIGIALMVNNPPCYRGASDPNNGKGNYVEAVVSQIEPTYFARVVGFNNVPLVARAEAMRTGNPNCIYALDPYGANALTVNVLATLSASCGVVVESNSWAAFSCNLLSAVNIPALKITGGIESFLCSVNPAPKTGVAVPSPADPLASLPKPSLLSCGSSTSSPYHGANSQLLIVGNATLYPDAAYCGGIQLLPTAHVTFMPGTYVIRSGGFLGLQGGLSFDLGAGVTGSGVTFYNYGPIGGVTFLASSFTFSGFTLTAPTSGTYSGILFFQDPGNTSAATIIGTSSWNTTLEGAFYFPSASVNSALSGLQKYNILVARDISFSVLTFASASLNTTSYGNDYSGLANGSPIGGTGAVLVQ